MRNNLWIIPLMFLMFTGCQTTVDGNKERSGKIAGSGTKNGDQYLVSLETLSASDGIVDGYIEYSYNSNGQLIEKIDLDSDRKQKNKMVNSYTNGINTSTQWFLGENDEPGITIEKEYEGSLLIREISVDTDDIAQSISTYEYDEIGNIKKWTVSSGINVPMMITEYEFKNDIKTNAIFLSPLGSKEGYIEYKYAGSKIKSEKTYTQNNSIEKTVTYKYNGDTLIKETHYKKTIIDYTIEYEYDQNRNITTKKHFYRSGNLKSLWSYEYINLKDEV